MSSLTDTQSAESSRSVEGRPQLPHRPGQLTPDPTGKVEVPAAWPDVVATVREDGSAEVTIAGVEHRVHEATLALARDAIVAQVGEQAAMPLGRPVRLLTTDPAGQWRLIVHPDGKVEAAEAGTYPTPAVEMPAAGHEEAARAKPSSLDGSERETALSIDAAVDAPQRQR